jgi:glycosyltransferase involved in cell wall biosynthesis
MSCLKQKTRILFVYSVLPSFIRTDLEILQKHFDVKKLKTETFFVPQRGKSFLSFLRLLKGILWANIAFTWFADVNAFFIVVFCKFLRKKSVIVVGGYDIVYIPEIDYGDLKSPFARIRTKFILNHASKILPFSNYAKERVMNITRKVNAYAIPLACDTEKFRPINEKKENLVITVCYVDKSNIKRKGLKTFVESAKFLPQLRFALIGSHIDDSINHLKEISSSNVEFTGFVQDEELFAFYQRAKVYCQLSYEEGFGVSLIEAMACACVPVVSLKAKVFRETVGEYGFYTPYGDVEKTVEAIKKASKASNLGIKVRERVNDLFSIAKREKELLRVINDMCKQA